MKEHPIIFSTEMVKAIIAGKKTMTRRVMKYPMTIQPEMDFNCLELNAEKGKLLRDTGIGMAVDHADGVERKWSERAYDLFINKFLLNHNGPFQAEEFRSYCALIDFPLPPSARAFGGVIRKAAIAGIIKSAGTRPVRNPKAHRANAAVWLQVKPSQQKK